MVRNNSMLVIGLIGLMFQHNTILGKAIDVQRAVKRKLGRIQKDADGNNPLHRAVLRNAPLGSIKRDVTLMVDADVNSMNDKGETPLHIAVDKNREDLIRYFLEEAKANIRIRSKRGETSFWRAVEKSLSPDIIRLFIKKGANVDEYNYNFSKTVLYLAAEQFASSKTEQERKRRLEIMKIFVANGVNLHAKTESFSIPWRALSLGSRNMSIQETPEYKEAEKLLRWW